MALIIRKINDSDKSWIAEMVQSWGADFIVSRKRKIYPIHLDGFIAEENNKKLGLISFDIRNNECEIVLFEVLEKQSGIGSEMLSAVLKYAQEKKYKRVWLITTNDNLDALRFYQRRGFYFRKLYRNAIQESRKIKPTIPDQGKYEISIRDEIELDNIKD